jgi:hypothetical protein
MNDHNQSRRYLLVHRAYCSCCNAIAAALALAAHTTALVEREYRQA